MTGKRVLITGPTSGIGRQIALDLGARGASLVLACRDVERGRELADEIARSGGDADVVSMDTSSQRSIRDGAARCRARAPRLDVLVNNAGTIQSERRESVDGIELTLATNVLGYHLLAHELLPALGGRDDARIVIVASAFAGDLDLDDIQFTRRPYDGFAAYRQSKACDRLWSWALARRATALGITVNAMTPGWVPDTGLSRDLSPAIREARARPGRSVAEGADTAVWMASDAALAGVTGRFYMDRREIPCDFRDVATEERLWMICAALTGAGSEQHTRP